MANFLTQKIGPIPLWGYGLGAAGITLVILLSSKNKAAPAKKPAASSTTAASKKTGPNADDSDLTGYSDLANSFAGQLVGMVNQPQKSTVTQGLPGPAGPAGPAGPIGAAGAAGAAGTTPSPAPTVKQGPMVSLEGFQFRLNPDPMPTMVPAQIWQYVPAWASTGRQAGMYWVYWGGQQPYLYADTGYGGQTAPPDIQKLLTIVSPGSPDNTAPEV